MGIAYLKKRMKTWVILPIIAILTAPLFAAATETVVGGHPGYVFDVEREKHQRVNELVLMERPPATKPIKDKLFDEKMTKDIREQYELRFGRTAMEQSLNGTGSFSRDSAFYYRGDSTVTTRDFVKYQRSFGEYIGRRVIENQFDIYTKNDPSLRPIHAFKDRISNVTVQTKGGYKFKWRYDISGNNMNLELENPYRIEAKAKIQFRQFSYETEEEILSLGYKIDKRHAVSTYYKFYDGIFQVVGSRVLTPSVSASISGSTANAGNGPSVRQDIVLVGISWTQ